MYSSPTPLFTLLDCFLPAVFSALRSNWPRQHSLHRLAPLHSVHKFSGVIDTSIPGQQKQALALTLVSESGPGRSRQILSKAVQADTDDPVVKLGVVQELTGRLGILG